MNNIVSNQNTKNSVGICGHYGVKGFLSRFWVDKINFAHLYDHWPIIYLVFSFGPWYDGRSTNTTIDETANQPDTELIAQASRFFIMDAPD